MKLVKRLIQLIAVVLVFTLAYSGWSVYQSSKNNPGEPFQVVTATWMRDHGLGPVVAKLEDLYYQYINKPEVGGKPTVSAQIDNEVTAVTVEPSQMPTSASPAASASASAIVDPTPTFTFAPAPAVTTQPLPSDGAIVHLNPPDTLISPASVPEPLEGVWQPVGNKVAGLPAVYVTRVRTDNVHTSYYATAMWIDTSLTTTMFIPGYEEPKGGPNPYNGSLPEQYWPLIMANINGAFRLEDTRGGYFYDNITVQPLEKKRASAVIYRDGHMTIGRWGRDLQLTPEMLVVRQNLDLIVDHGQSQVNNPSYSASWGATTDKGNLAWRAGLGQRRDGSLVFVIGQALSAQSLADTLVASGAQRAMVLDMNQYWSAGFFFTHNRAGDPICHRLDPDIGGPCDRFLHSYKRDSFQFLAAYPVGRRIAQ
ncbi:unannotated protein [freshwater metagenome]|uniref:Unannotated protein n=1 Tax=freshwater metagenome TaxID=449393 RepID=A0A6J6KW14_9ZZZZ|nr:hypothetical protein [Actinomycetota bacterium]MSY37924.1 hypothetical protein [Actinomycetota bacterium]